MTIDELIPSIAPLSHADKIRLVQTVLEQLAQEERKSDQPSHPGSERFDPRRFHGAGQPSSVASNPLKDSVTFEKDILSPIGDDWDAAR